MRRALAGGVAAAMLLVAMVGLASMTSAQTTRAHEHATATQLDDLHAARPVAAHHEPTRFDMPDGTSLPASAVDGISYYLIIRYVSAVEAAHQQAVSDFLHAVAVATETKRNRPAPQRRAATTQSSSGGGDFFACVRHHESRGNYGVVNRSSGAAGAYQFMPTTWNNAAREAGRGDLVGVSPAAASPTDQDFVAHYVYSTQGARPWNGSGCG
jgi:hypothetical protein